MPTITVLYTLRTDCPEPCNPASTLINLIPCTFNPRAMRTAQPLHRLWLSCTMPTKRWHVAHSAGGRLREGTTDGQCRRCSSDNQRPWSPLAPVCRRAFTVHWFFSFKMACHALFDNLVSRPAVRPTSSFLPTTSSQLSPRNASSLKLAL